MHSSYLVVVKQTNDLKQQISLRGNRIQKLAMDAFGNYHPHTLDLSRNQLTYLDEFTFAPLLMNNTVINVDGKSIKTDYTDLTNQLIF